jgi:hypothetical protein
VWWTEDGERVLHGAEWELFRAGLDYVWDDVEASIDGDECFPSGVAAFDDLQPGQKLALLAHVGRALRDEAVPCPDLTSHAEATIAAIFEQVRHSIVIETELEDDGSDAGAFYWRRLILAACLETGIVGEDPLPAESCGDSGEWDLLVECLADRILWDDDFMAGQHFLDGDPDESRARMQALGIADNYFVALAPDPGAAELEAIRRTLRDITGRNRRSKDE